MTLYRAYEARCDRCGRRVLVRDSNYHAQLRPVIDHLRAEGWRVDDGICQCPACAEREPGTGIETVEVTP